MARTPKKKKKTEPRQDQQKADSPHVVPVSHGVRETIESIVIAFVLAFLFRTFEAEAFVIPTGSMAHTLRGAHKDVECPKCGFRYQASASEEAEEFTSPWKAELASIKSDLAENKQRLAEAKTDFDRDRLEREQTELWKKWQHHRRNDIVDITCPMCRYTMPVDPVPGVDPANDEEGRLGAEQPTYNGDRILVSKFAYEFEEPRRWDVIVFKFPGGASTNYIKRLVGLPGETIRIRQGDIFTVKDDQPQIVRKPPHKVRAMASLVHDNHYQPGELIDAGWPFRWQPWPPGRSAEADGWQVTTAGDDKNSWQVFQAEDRGDKTDWIRYRHFVPDTDDWQQIRQGRLSQKEIDALRPQLITDFYAYNTHVSRLEKDGFNGFDRSAQRLGLHWVGDLMLQADVQVESNAGELLLDLVKGGRHFTATLDVASGKATLTIDDVADFAPTAQTILRGPGQYTVAFANVDEQLLLWINDSLVTFDKPTTYERKQVFGLGEGIVPQSTDEDAGDLAPAGVGSRGARLSVDHLRLSRDIYYIADRDARMGEPITDYDRNEEPFKGLSVPELEGFLSEPSRWPATFDDPHYIEFDVGPDEFFVLGDNSPYSKDGRLWDDGNIGHTVPRKLLIGKALYIYWPHSWGKIPYAPQWLPGWPAFGDMGLVR